MYRLATLNTDYFEKSKKKKNTVQSVFSNTKHLSIINICGIFERQLKINAC